MSKDDVVTEDAAVETTDSDAVPSDDAIEAKIRETMGLEDEDDAEMEAILRGEDPKETDEGDSKDSEDDSDSEEVEDEGDEKPDTDDDPEEEPTEEDKPEPGPELDEKTLNAAKMMGIPADDVAALAKQGEYGERMLERIRASATNQGRAWSENGRLKQQLAKLETPEPETAEDGSPKEPESEPAVEKFRAEDWGEEDANRLNALAAKANKADELETELNRVLEYVDKQEEREAAAEVGKFFDGLDGKTYADFGAGSSLSESEVQARGEVVDKAVELIAGAEYAGKTLDYQTALQQALLLVRPDAQTKAVRRDLKEKVVKRKKGITARPTPRRTTKPKKDGEQEAMDALRDLAASRPEVARFFDRNSD